MRPALLPDMSRTAERLRRPAVRRTAGSETRAEQEQRSKRSRFPGGRGARRRHDLPRSACYAAQATSLPCAVRCVVLTEVDSRVGDPDTGLLSRAVRAMGQEVHPVCWTRPFDRNPAVDSGLASADPGRGDQVAQLGRRRKPMPLRSRGDRAEHRRSKHPRFSGGVRDARRPRVLPESACRAARRRRLVVRYVDRGLLARR